ncbi:MAG: hypothetical protein ABF705_11600, partial [Acetobacter syzygii]
VARSLGHNLTRQGGNHKQGYNTGAEKGHRLKPPDVWKVEKMTCHGNCKRAMLKRGGKLRF